MFKQQVQALNKKAIGPAFGGVKSDFQIS